MTQMISFWSLYGSSSPEVFRKKRYSEKPLKIEEKNTFAGVYFQIKLQAVYVFNSIKKKLHYSCFSVNFTEVFKTALL